MSECQAVFAASGACSVPVWSKLCKKPSTLSLCNVHLLPKGCEIAPEDAAVETDKPQFHWPKPSLLLGERRRSFVTPHPHAIRARIQSLSWAPGELEDV